MEMFQDDLSCMQCGRDYEMPRRYVIKVDDIDYAPVPRLLNCLHSCCSSCCEEMFQRSGSEQKIICPVCRESQRVKSVRTLPLDSIALRHLYEAGGAEMMAYCSRCHDEVESYSWCFDCQSALCDFHHQDHIKSIDTVEHKIETFQDIHEKNIPIDRHLPPISCPETLVADCSAYCKTCSHLISAQGMVRHHLKCDVKLGKELYDSSKDAITTAADRVVMREDELEGAMDHIKKVMLQLDDEKTSVGMCCS
jgi:hypothetical protein